jgi:BASS family bile acid:Na+ symporter
MWNFVKKSKEFSFTIIIIVGVALAMLFPDFFTTMGGFSLKKLIVPLIQIIMIGMGTSMSLTDFVGVIKMPKGVLVGLACQLSIMPFIGWLLATVLPFPDEIAAGIILIGCSPSGTASNVMTYIAKGNLALSVTLTAIATLLSPLTTPFLMQLLAGQKVPIDSIEMMKGIVQIVVIPVMIGLILNKIFRYRAKKLLAVFPLISMIGIAVVITIITAAGRDSLLNVGILLLIAAFVHNTLGYFFGYWCSKMAGMSVSDCRTIAIEVGLQNAGLASGIAMQMNKIATVGLAPALFGPIMNTTGSILSNYWRKNNK